VNERDRDLVTVGLLVAALAFWLVALLVRFA